MQKYIYIKTRAARRCTSYSCFFHGSYSLQLAGAGLDPNRDRRTRIEQSTVSLTQLHTQSTINRNAIWTMGRGIDRGVSRNFPAPATFGIMRHRCPHRGFMGLFLLCIIVVSMYFD
jgi:hypothetical protein